jgi:hypothetical protein
MTVVCGDEDDDCLQPGIFFKFKLKKDDTGLRARYPRRPATRSKIEEPAAFNALAEFIAQVEAGRRLARDPRAQPGQIMRTK